MSRLSCVQNCLCPDYRAFKDAYVQTIVCSKLHMSRLSCVQNCLCPDYRAFKVAYVQTIVCSKLHMSRLSCVQNCLCPDYRAFKVAYVQTIVCSKLHMSRLSCVQNCICSDYRAFIFFPDRVILNARRHLVRSFRSGHIDFRSGTSIWVAFLQSHYLLKEISFHVKSVLKHKKGFDQTQSDSISFECCQYRFWVNNNLWGCPRHANCSA